MMAGFDSLSHFKLTFCTFMGVSREDCGQGKELGVV